MLTYRVFIGMWDDGDPDWTHFDESGLTWEAARDLLAMKLKSWENDTCEDCRADAADDLARLMKLDPGQPFEGGVEGDDYLILVESK